MDWQNAISGFRIHLKCERAYSPNTISAYLSDVHRLHTYLINHRIEQASPKIEETHLHEFIQDLGRNSLKASSQSRIIRGLKSFFRYLAMEGLNTENLADTIEYPRLPKLIPETLSELEINRLLKSIKLNSRFGIRNRAIVETLYACGLRASELCNFKLSNYKPHRKFIRVTGKGDKERDIPIGGSAIHWINKYITLDRNHRKIILKGHEDITFLNARGRRLNRSYVGELVRKTTLESRLNKCVSPHIFRHSFATHLIQGGAPLHAVKDMLGHEAITSTERYVSVDIEDLRDTLIVYHPRFKM